MPKLQRWCAVLLFCASPLGLAAEKKPAIPTAVKAPEQPSVALLEFIGDWETDERQLIGMEIQVKNSKPQQKPKEERHAP